MPFMLDTYLVIFFIPFFLLHEKLSMPFLVFHSNQPISCSQKKKKKKRLVGKKAMSSTETNSSSKSILDLYLALKRPKFQAENCGSQQSNADTKRLYDTALKRNQIWFLAPDDIPFGIFSNEYPHKIEFQERSFHCVKHCFEEISQHWQKSQIDLMYSIVFTKFWSSKELANILLATSRHRLIQHNEFEKFWSDGGDIEAGSGLNVVILWGKKMNNIQDSHISFSC